MFARLRDRPWLVALLLAVLAQTLFTLHLGRPSKLVFDEVHYVPAARALLGLEQALNTEHPLLAKELIALSIALFGDDAIGWRALSTLAGTATVLASFAILMLLFGRVRTAAAGALLVLLNQTVFVQARIAMLDGFLGAFVLGAIAALLWAAQAPAGRVWPRIFLAGLLAGCAVAVKWAAIPYVALACMAIAWVRWRDRAGLLTARNQPHWPGIRTIDAILAFGGVALAVYFLSFAPTLFYARDALSVGEIVPFQWKMLAAQTQVLTPHSYQSDWWSWPLLIRPIWYFYEPADGAVRGILLIGNPAIMWGGLVAVGLCWWAAWRGSAPHFLLAFLWSFSLLIFAIIPKSLGFYYYYHLSGIFIALAIAGAADHLRARFPSAIWWFLAAATLAFVWFYPIIAAAPLANDQAFNHWMWFDSWR